MPYEKGKSGNPKGSKPGARTPSNKKIKAALKRCSLEAIENLSDYMGATRNYIDTAWKKHNALVIQAESELDQELKKKLLDEVETARRDIFSFYNKLHNVSETLLAYTHKHIVNEERVNRTTSTQPDEKEKDEEDEDEGEPRVSLSAVPVPA